VSATGIVIFYSHCACTGNEHVSVYVSPETCADNFHTHHTHNEAGEEACSSASECHECNAHTNECSCNSPDIRLLKLGNQVVNEKVRIEKLQPLQLKILQHIAAILLIDPGNLTGIEFTYFDPPPKNPTSFDFLIRIHQLKIHCLA
jgi:hypothetical protein